MAAGTMLDQVLDTLRAEFSDVPDVAQITRIVVRLLLAAALGGLLGYERERQGKAAGLRTHMLVSLGAALFVLVPQQAGMGIVDMSRVIQGVIAGIGFLGAGAIIKHGSEANVQGLTTAAGVWMTAAIGIACGLGRETTAVMSTALALAILTLIPRWFDRDGATPSADEPPVQGGPGRLGERGEPEPGGERRPRPGRDDRAR